MESMDFASSTTSRIFEKSRTIGFVIYRNGEKIGYHWMRHAESDVVGTEKIESKLDLDLSSFDTGKIQRSSEMILQYSGEPVSYISTGTGGKVEIKMQDNTAI